MYPIPAHCHTLPHGFSKPFWDHYPGIPDTALSTKQPLLLVCLPNCYLIICVQDRTVSTINYLKTWAVGIVGHFLVLNLTASLFYCVLLFSDDIFLLYPVLLIPYLFLMWKRPNSCFILVHWELNIGVIVTFLCLSLVLAMPEQNQVYSGWRVQLASLWTLTFMVIIKNLRLGQGIGSGLVISVSIRAVGSRYIHFAGEAVIKI